MVVMPVIRVQRRPLHGAAELPLLEGLCVGRLLAGESGDLPPAAADIPLAA